MRRALSILALLVMLAYKAVGQEEGKGTTVNLDLLKAPTSPAFNMLGIAPSDIERPTDLNAFMVSLQNATNNFNTIPQSFGFEFAPFLMGSKRQYTLDEFDDNKHSLLQSFLISAGFTHMGPEGIEDVDSLKTTKAALGIKFAIVRPRWSEETRNAYAILITALGELLDEVKAYDSLQHRVDSLLVRFNALEFKQNHTAMDVDTMRMLREEIRLLTVQHNEAARKKIQRSENFARVQELATSFKTERKGFFLDFAGGLSLDFPDSRFDNSYVQKGGVWLTAGNENGNSGVTTMFIARYLYQPDAIFADPLGKLSTDNVSTFDAGARFLLSAMKDKFNVSGEALYRSVLGREDIDASWRLIINAEYDLKENQKLTFAFGRNFDGTISNGGNLVAALNFIAGFGSKRKIANK